MRKQRIANEIRISNQYAFAKVMKDNPELFRQTAERLLGIEIDSVQSIETEDSEVLILNKSVCFDAVLKGSNAVVEIEMQTSEEKDLPKRLRYYHSMIDRRILPKGSDYCELKSVYVVFLCTYDEFGLGLPVYVFRRRCEQDGSLVLDDGMTSVILNARGDMSLADEKVAPVLEYVMTNAPRDELTHLLSKALDEAKRDEVWMANMDIFEMDRRMDERRAEQRGREQGAADERERQSKLIEALTLDGWEPGDILAAMKSEGIAALYERYAIKRNAN